MYLTELPYINKLLNPLISDICLIFVADILSLIFKPGPSWPPICDNKTICWDICSPRLSISDCLTTSLT